MTPQSSRTTRADESIFSKLSRRTRQEIEALIGSRQAEQALAEKEAETIERRKLLLAQRALIERNQAAEETRRGAIASTTNKALADAEAQVLQARKDATAASLASYGADLAMRGKLRAIDEEIEALADERLNDFIAACRSLSDADLPMRVRYWIAHRPNSAGGDYVDNNWGEVEAAKSALLGAIESAEALKRAPLGYVEVSQELARLCGDLAPKLAPVECNPPCLVGDQCEIVFALSWTGSPRWVVDLSPELTDAQRAEIAEDRRRRLEASARVTKR